MAAGAGACRCGRPVGCFEYAHHVKHRGQRALRKDLPEPAARQRQHTPRRLDWVSAVHAGRGRGFTQRRGAEQAARVRVGQQSVLLPDPAPHSAPPAARRPSPRTRQLVLYQFQSLVPWSHALNHLAVECRVLWKPITRTGKGLAPLCRQNRVAPCQEVRLALNEQHPRGNVQCLPGPWRSACQRRS